MGASTLTDTNLVLCPKCNGQMWDNRTTKKNAKAPDWKCKTRTCEGVVWPEKPVKGNNTAPVALVPIIDPVKKPTMREAYKELTKWVKSDIAALYEDDFDATTLAAITATLFIQACKSGKVE